MDDDYDDDNDDDNDNDIDELRQDQNDCVSNLKMPCVFIYLLPLLWLVFCINRWI